MSEKVARPEIVRALRVAHDEMLTLQRRVAELEPRAHAYDTIAQMTRLTQQPPECGMRVDPVWEVKSLHDRLVAERTAEAAKEETQ